MSPQGGIGSPETRRNVVALLAGALFSLGLSLAGMTHPAKVLAFLDVFGAWDPSLAFVMVGAIGVSAVAFRWAGRLQSPALGGRFSVLRASTAITPRLVVGAAIFGAGWGLSGVCPGPAVTSLASGQVAGLVFVVSMLGGMAMAPAPAAHEPSAGAVEGEGQAHARG